MMNILKKNAPVAPATTEKSEPALDGPVLRWGVVGAGAMAVRMGADIVITPGNRVVACAARTTTRSAAIASTFAARLEPTIDGLFSATDIDVVYIATPPASHAELAVAAMQAGKHVLIEKPFAVTESDARLIAEAARETGRFCMEAMWTRFLPAVEAALDLAAHGGLGELRQLTADFSYAVVVNPSHHVFTPGGGGALLDRAVYGVSLAVAALGPVVDVVSTARKGTTGVDEDVALMLNHRSGSISTITASLRSRGSNEAILRGTQASVTLHEPFFGATRYSLVAAVPADLGRTGTASGAGTASKLMGEVMGRLGKSVRASQAIEAAKGVTKAGLLQLKATSVPTLGHGYSHQVAAVREAIQADLTEHPKMSLAHSLEVMQILDRARSSWLSVR